MATSKAQPDAFGWIEFESSANQLPSFGDALLGAGHLEVVDVDDEHEVQVVMPVAAVP